MENQRIRGQDVCANLKSILTERLDGLSLSKKMFVDLVADLSGKIKKCGWHFADTLLEEKVYVWASHSVNGSVTICNLVRRSQFVVQGVNSQETWSCLVPNSVSRHATELPAGCLIVGTER